MLENETLDSENTKEEKVESAVENKVEKEEEASSLPQTDTPSTVSSSASSVSNTC